MAKSKAKEDRIKLASRQLASSITESLSNNELAGLPEFAQRLGHTASLGDRAGHGAVARALGETALVLDPHNVRTANALVQMQYRHRNYRRVIELGSHQVSDATGIALTEASSIARLFVGMASIAVSPDSPKEEKRLQIGCKNVLLAYQQWISQARANERNSIVNSLGRLLILGNSVGALVQILDIIDEVLNFADRQGTWNRNPMTMGDVKEAADYFTAEDVVESPWSQE
ncbi:MAG: hypothetical protein U0U69_05750 [Acidimicrobiia bacterium]